MKHQFSKPVPFKEFEATCCGKEKAAKPGIYIWGFKKDHKFIPYYVGKSESSVWERVVKGHHSDIQSKCTYTLFEPDFYTELSENLSKIPPCAEPRHKFYEKNYEKAGEEFKEKVLDKLIYLNDPDWIKKKYGISCPKNTSLQELMKKREFKKSDRDLCVKTLEIHRDQVYVSYACPSYSNNKALRKLEIKSGETETKWAIYDAQKIMTVSDSGSRIIKSSIELESLSL